MRDFAVEALYKILRQINTTYTDEYVRMLAEDLIKMAREVGRQMKEDCK